TNSEIGPVDIGVSGAKDVGGNLQAPDSLPSAFSIDTKNPTVTVDIVQSALSDSTNTSNVTFTFSEDPVGFADADVTASGGTLSALVQDDTTHYRATFTATDGIETSGSVTVAAGSYTDAIGNSGVVGSDTVTIDTKNPNVTVDIVQSALSD